MSPRLCDSFRNIAWNFPVSVCFPNNRTVSSLIFGNSGCVSCLFNGKINNLSCLVAEVGSPAVFSASTGTKIGSATTAES